MNKIEPYKEQQLLQLIANGQETAFNELFAYYRNPLYSYLLKIVKAPAVAEEIVLDVFLKIWTGRQLLPEIIHFEAFLKKVAHNKAIDFIRKLQRSPALQQPVKDSIIGYQSDLADASLKLAEMEAAIQQAVTQLSPQRQKVFELSKQQGLNNEEIAIRLNLSKNTVRNHLAASLEFIRNFLQKENPEMLVWFCTCYSSLN